jgi:cytochrome c oxidase subunit 2
MGGCGGVQSALSPRGAQAEDVAVLAWVLFGLAALVLLIVIAAAYFAMRGPPAIRRPLGGRRAVYIGGIAFPAIVLTALLGYGVSQMRASIETLADPPAVRIEVVGEQWWWRTAYLAPEGGRIPGANEIRLPVGRDVELTLLSADVIHSFWVPTLAGKVDMIPGRTNRLRLRADRAGVYRGQCAEYCGGPHALMALDVIALPEPEYDAWLAAQAAPANEASTGAEADGKALFLAAGCAACHAIRGIGAEGTVGPDLTHLGSRRSLAAATLPLTQENIARFIADGQHIKPNNRMPPFRIFSDAELQALAAYLAGLK